MRVTAIIENISHRENLLSQYGLSLLVQTKGGTLLLDAGSDESAYMNFRALELDVGSIDAIVASHNHFDHMGGLPFFLDATKAAAYISKGALNSLYTKSFFSRKSLVSRTDIVETYKDRFNFVEDVTEVFPKVYLCLIKNCDEEFMCKDKKLKQLSDNKLIADNFSHELYIAVIEDNECKILSSCSHSGIVNILTDAANRFKSIPVTTFVGGLHLRGRSSNSLNCSRKYARTVFEKIENFGIKKLYTCHCTGAKAFSLLKEHKSIEAFYFSTGDSFEI